MKISEIITETNKLAPNIIVKSLEQVVSVWYVQLFDYIQSHTQQEFEVYVLQRAVKYQLETKLSKSLSPIIQHYVREILGYTNYSCNVIIKINKEYDNVTGEAHIFDEWTNNKNTLTLYPSFDDCLHYQKMKNNSGCIHYMVSTILHELNHVQQSLKSNNKKIQSKPFNDKYDIEHLKKYEIESYAHQVVYTLLHNKINKQSNPIEYWNTILRPALAKSKEITVLLTIPQYKTYRNLFFRYKNSKNLEVRDAVTRSWRLFNNIIYKNIQSYIDDEGFKD